MKYNLSRPLQDIEVQAIDTVLDWALKHKGSKALQTVTIVLNALRGNLYQVEEASSSESASHNTQASEEIHTTIDTMEELMEAIKDEAL
jgi:hypothetical protein